MITGWNVHSRASSRAYGVLLKGVKDMLAVGLLCIASASSSLCVAGIVLGIVYRVRPSSPHPPTDTIKDSVNVSKSLTNTALSSEGGRQGLQQESRGSPRFSSYRCMTSSTLSCPSLRLLISQTAIILLCVILWSFTMYAAPKTVWCKAPLTPSSSFQAHWPL